MRQKKPLRRQQWRAADLFSFVSHTKLSGKSNGIRPRGWETHLQMSLRHRKARPQTKLRRHKSRKWSRPERGEEDLQKTGKPAARSGGRRLQWRS